MVFFNFHLFSPLYEKMEGVDIRRAQKLEGSLYDHVPTDRHTRHRCIFVIVKTKTRSPKSPCYTYFIDYYLTFFDCLSSENNSES